MQNQVMTLCPLRCATKCTARQPRRASLDPFRHARSTAFRSVSRPCSRWPWPDVPAHRHIRWKNNLLNGARVTEITGITRAARLTDGRLAVEGDFWLTSLATRIGSARSRITYDLGAEKPIGCAFVQGDDNDTYRLLGSRTARIGDVVVGGTRAGRWHAAAPDHADRQRTIRRLMAQGGDGFYT